MPAPPGVRRTARLRLEPAAPGHGGDLWRLHQDEAVAAWWGGPWSLEDADRYAAAMARAWAVDGVGKWVAYDLETGDLVGRGGLSRLPAGGDLTGRIAALAGEAWARDRLEVGWTVRSDRWGRGYATELGRGGGRLHRAAQPPLPGGDERLGMADVGEVHAPGLVEGRPGVHHDAPFALYALAATCWR
jgi:hypothetical protein